MSNIKTLADSIMFDHLVERLMESGNIDIIEARRILSEMSFMEYHKLLEAGTAIVPPSGNMIGPSTNSITPTNQPTKIGGTGAKAIWPGQGAPVEVGMTVGLKGPNGLPVPGQVSQVDQPAKGVKVKNPTTGQDEWVNTANLQPYMAANSAKPAATNPQQTQTNQAGSGIQATAENAQLQRLRELAGIKENCSAGATGAGSIAVVPAAMGGVKKRQPTEEELKKEYTRTAPAKTVIGDTKPHQNMGELSATLAANGKPAAGRINNGRKKR